jgi:hypothetical protein
MTHSTSASRVSVSSGIPAPRHVTDTASAATRHLCAGAYIDPAFRRASLREVYYQSGRMVAPSYGFDLPAVLQHCLRARNIALARDIVLLGVLFFLAILAPLAFFLVFAVLWSVYFAVEVWRVLIDAARRLGSDDPIGAGAVLARLAYLGLRFVVAYVLSLIVTGFVLALTSVAYGGGAGPFGALTGGGVSEQALRTQLVGSVFAMLLVFGIPTTANVVNQIQVDGLAPGRSPGGTASSDRFAEINFQLRGNQIVYSGFWPFVGSGDLVTRWSFAQRLMRAPKDPLGGHESEASREFTTPPFTAHEVLDTIRWHLTSLSHETAPERRVPGLTVQDKIFVAGTELSYLVPHASSETVAQVIRDPTAPRRHFLVCQVESWRGELVTTVYVHVAVQGKLLYIELVGTALPPCDPRYRVIDQVGGTGPVAYARAIGSGLVRTPQFVIGAIGNIVRSTFDVVVGSLSRPALAADRAVTHGYDFGARTSVRDLGSALDTRDYLQNQDFDKYHQVIERRVLAAVLDFLASRGVDTAEFTDQAQHILNIGAVHHGKGDIKIDGPGVGTVHHSGREGRK